MFQNHLRMSEENENILGITIPLAKIVPTRCSSRKRAPPNFFVPSHFRPSPRLTGRGRGRPKKESSDGKIELNVFLKLSFFTIPAFLLLSCHDSFIIIFYFNIILI